MSITRRSRRLKNLKLKHGKGVEISRKAKLAGRHDGPQNLQTSKLWFRYRTLNLRSDDIRVISVLPAESENSPIRCTLEHVPLSSTHSCLSYTWGSEDTDRLIYINDRSFLVRPNLWQFLRRARKSNISGPLWIDAICIKQNDNKERNHQVSRMARIYSTANCVYIWLGCGSQTIEMALQSVKSAVSRKPDELADPYGLPVSSRVLPSLRTIMALPYWSRLWIIQEVLLSRNAKVVYGETEVSWTAFSELAAYANDVLGRIEEFRRIVRLVETRDQMETEISRIRFLIDIPEGHENALAWISEVESINIPRLRDIVTLQDHLSDGRRPCLMDLVITFVSSQCENPRDHIYALLGLAADGYDFGVDYEESCSALLLRVLQAYRTGSREQLLLRIQLLSRALAITDEALRTTCLQRYPEAMSDPWLSPISSEVELWRSLSWQRIFRQRVNHRFWTRSVKIITALELCSWHRESITSNEGWNGLIGISNVTSMTDLDSFAKAYSEIPEVDLVIGLADSADCTVAALGGRFYCLERSMVLGKWCNSHAMLVRNWAQDDLPTECQDAAIQIADCGDKWCLCTDPGIYDLLPNKLSRRLYLALEQELRTLWQLREQDQPTTQLHDDMFSSGLPSDRSYFHLRSTEGFLNR